MEVRSPFQQLSAPITRLQCHPWSFFFIPFLPVSLTGQGKLHFRECFAVKQLLQGLELKQDLPAPGWTLKPPCCWIKRGFFCRIPGEGPIPQPRGYAREERMHINTVTHDLDPPAHAVQKIIQYSRRDVEGVWWLQPSPGHGSPGHGSTSDYLCIVH